MQADKREFCDVVIETNIGAPALIVVTLIAFFTLLSFVDVVVFVTVNTGFIRLVFIGVFFMTTTTGRGGMFAV